MFCNLKQAPKLYKKELYFGNENSWNTQPPDVKDDDSKYVKDDVVYLYEPRYKNINQPIKKDVRYQIVKDSEIKNNVQNKSYDEYIVENNLSYNRRDYLNLNYAIIVFFLFNIMYILFKVLKSFI